MKQFNELVKGDVGTDYHGQKVTIQAKGGVDYLFKIWGDMVETPRDSFTDADFDDDAVLVSYPGDKKKQDLYIFPYGDAGVTVNTEADKLAAYAKLQTVNEAAAAMKRNYKQITDIVDKNLFLEALDLCCWDDVDGGRSWEYSDGLVPLENDYSDAIIQAYETPMSFTN